jgi:3-deoxy-manno-octulosonate cytidylyltransferase (CMP-KDO synthetase)
MNALAVIPARYDSRRFPGKPLARLGGRPIVEWVWSAVASCPHFARVVVATDDVRIAQCVSSFGGEVEMTSADHVTGTDRVAEVAERYREIDVVANVQGDQPFVSARQLSDLLTPYLNGHAPAMTTLACHLKGPRVDDPNVVKVVCDIEGRALYFSRAPIPYSFEAGADFLHHLGLYAFRADFLREYARLRRTELEARERLEQLRALAYGYRITVCQTNEGVLEVNTPADLRQAESLLRQAELA